MASVPKGFSMPPYSLTADPRISMTAKAAYSALMRFALGSGGTCREPASGVARACGNISERALNRAVSELEEYRYVRRCGNKRARFAVEILAAPDYDFDEACDSVKNDGVTPSKTTESLRQKRRSRIITPSKTTEYSVKNDGVTPSKTTESGVPIILERIEEDKKTTQFAGGGGEELEPFHSPADPGPIPEEVIGPDLARLIEWITVGLAKAYPGDDSLLENVIRSAKSWSSIEGYHPADIAEAINTAIANRATGGGFVNYAKKPLMRLKVERDSGGPKAPRSTFKAAAARPIGDGDVAPPEVRELYERLYPRPDRGKRSRT